MKKLTLALALVCFTAISVVAQNSVHALEATWGTEGVPAFEAARSAGKSLNGLPEAVTIKFKVDAKNNKISGQIDQMNANLKLDVKDGKLSDKTFTFVTDVQSSTGQTVKINWKGELQDQDTVVLSRIGADGAVTAKLVFHRMAKK
jgi:hypothetical protein